MINSNLLQKLRHYFANMPVAAVYLFGSQATGTATAKSDYDIGILYDPVLTQHQIFKKELKIISDLCVILSVDCVDVVDLHRAPVALQFSAVFPRAEIIVRDRNAAVLFEADVLSRYFDYSYYLKQNTHYSLASIARMS